MIISRPSKHIVLYGLMLAAFVFLLKWLQWKYLIADHSVEFYVGAVALLFTLLGIWGASKLMRTQTREIVKEVVIVKEVPVVKEVPPLRDGESAPVFDKAAWEKLGLTARENEVLQQLVKGLSNAEIAANLFLSISTVKTHVSNLLFKLNVNSRVKAIEKARALRIIEPGAAIP
ncbi:MAG TPA: LuxR C-terminal-related transcriptional regulator [Flavihumibacter sp.]